MLLQPLRLQFWVFFPPHSLNVAWDSLGTGSWSIHGMERKGAAWPLAEPLNPRSGAGGPRVREAWCNHGV